MISALAIGSLANTVELASGDLRSGNAVFDGVKATWNQALKLGSLSSNVEAEYDSKVSKDFFKSATLTGSLLTPNAATAAKGKNPGVEASDVSVTYEIAHDFGSKRTDVKLTGSTVYDGTTVSAEVAEEDVVVSAARDVGLGDQSVNVDGGWLVKAKKARVKLMSKLGDSGKLSATVDYTVDGGDTAYEVSYDHSLQEGRAVSATTDGSALDVDYVDSKTENGATWTASASVPVDSSNILDAAKLTLKRAWTW
jgi:hypothetical protein